MDGGYVENSGLATIVDSAPVWLQEVQRRNAAALRTGAAQVDVIVPVVMYFDNDTGGDLVATRRGRPPRSSSPPRRTARQGCAGRHARPAAERGLGDRHDQPLRRVHRRPAEP